MCAIEGGFGFRALTQDAAVSVSVISASVSFCILIPVGDTLDGVTASGG